MKTTPNYLVSALLLAATSNLALAGLSGGVFSTDRLGYTGVVQRYNTLADAQNGVNQVGSDVTIGNRDLSAFVVADTPSIYPDINVLMGSWWYSTQGSPGYGNTTGNSGTGYMQLYDENSVTDTSLDFTWGGFNGTTYDSFQMVINGGGATYANSYARFWVDYQGSGADVVTFHEYTADITVFGVMGQQTGGDIVSNMHPTDALGSITGIFENVSSTYPSNNGFYTFDLAINTDNWAWDNRASLTDPYPFADSLFMTTAAIPEPSVALGGLTAMSLIGLAIRRRRARA
jgi:hypothetical protein